MSELMVTEYKTTDPWDLYRAGVRRADERDIGLIVAWLQGQNVGEEVPLWCSIHHHPSTGDVDQDIAISMKKSTFCVMGPVLVVPLDPKEGEK